MKKMRECNTIAVNEREREGEGQKQSRLTRLNNEKAYANIYPNVMLKMRTLNDVALCLFEVRDDHLATQACSLRV